MQPGNVSPTLRRSSRVPTALPILVTSMDGTQFSEVCETLVVNAHGCAMLSPAKLEAGIALRFRTRDGRQTTAYLVSCHPVGRDNRSWRLGARLDHPENFWGLPECPEDWALTAPTPPTLSVARPANALPSQDAQSQMSARSEAAFDRVVRQLEPPVKRMIAESLRPLEAQIEGLQKRLAYREANPGRFELSLTSIPPELEQQVQLRLRKDLGPKALEEARQQYADLLAAAKTTIDQRTAKGYEEFAVRMEQELRTAETRAMTITAQIAQSAQESSRGAMQEFHQKLVEGGNSLKRLGEEMLEYLQQSLNAEHIAHREDLERLRASVAAEASRLQEQMESLDTRIARLDESTRSLESGLDKRLSQMSSNTVKDTRSQLESLASYIHEELTTRSLKTLGDQLDETSANMKIVQRGVVVAVSESLKLEAANAVQAFDRSVDELAKRSIERWRLKLTDALSVLANSLGENPLPAHKPGEGNEV